MAKKNKKSRGFAAVAAPTLGEEQVVVATLEEAEAAAAFELEGVDVEDVQVTPAVVSVTTSKTRTRKPATPTHTTPVQDLLAANPGNPFGYDANAAVAHPAGYANALKHAKRKATYCARTGTPVAQQIPVGVSWVDAVGIFAAKGIDLLTAP